MHVRGIKQANKDGTVRTYCQLVESYRRTDGVPATRVLLHLGARSPVFVDNLKLALAASRQGLRVRSPQPDQQALVVELAHTLTYLPLAVVSRTFRGFGLDKLLDELCPPSPDAARLSTMVEVLVAQRCLAPDSKLSLQRWLPTTAVQHVMGVEPARFNNTRVHRVMAQLERVDERLQTALVKKLTVHEAPRVLYLDLTDTWFEAGGGSLSRRGQTKAGHRSKRKIHIALMIDPQGMPLRWQLMPGALSETTVLPEWVPALREQQVYANSILIFDRGLPSVDNFHRLIEDKQRFLTSIKSDCVPTYVALKTDTLDALQALDDTPTASQLDAHCEQLGFVRLNSITYARDLGLVQPPPPKAKSGKQLPSFRMYLYFNPEIRATKRQLRRERQAKAQSFVDKLNLELRNAKQPRKREPLQYKVKSELERLKLMDAYDIEVVAHQVQGKTKPIDSWQVKMTVKADVERNSRRYDGVCLLVAHPEVNLTLEQAIADYRNKNQVEADFRTMKSVLHLRPTYHRNDDKIRSHVTICVLGLLVERLIEQKLHQATTMSDCPTTADSLLQELDQVHVASLHINDQRYMLRDSAPERVVRLLHAIGAQEILDDIPSKASIPVALEA